MNHMAPVQLDYQTLIDAMRAAQSVVVRERWVLLRDDHGQEFVCSNSGSVMSIVNSHYFADLSSKTVFQSRDRQGLARPTRQQQWQGQHDFAFSQSCDTNHPDNIMEK